MAVLAPRKRTIDRFPNKDLAKAPRTFINNTDVYRALQGERRNWSVDEPDDPELDALYKKYLELLD